ncbi:bifunctional diguanylate cyclase/phosphodiesterase [Nocardioides sp.]|uniref:bifunctional diguanylate cyclase/phosphodiesterase n=1 Tax=Nocardioides sp. TaxID=35761 RepID=UPI0026181E7F|nr:bifunctional diguanylate cyclase/phosphodiesterase [Nocardioides sp.]
MPLTRRSVFDGLACVAALTVITGAVSAWQQRSPALSAEVLVTLGAAAVLALLAGVFVHGPTTREATPILAGSALAVLGTEQPDDLWPVVAAWALAVILGYRVLIGSWRQCLPRAATVIVAGAACAATMPWVDLHRAPYDRVLVGVVVFALAHAVLEWARPGHTGSPFGPRFAVLVCIGIVYAAGLVLVIDQASGFGEDPWPALATGAAVGLGGLAIAQAVHILMLTRVTDALTEASTTTPWAPDQIDDTLIRLVTAHVRAGSTAIEPTDAGPDTLSEHVRDGAVLVLRREPGDFAFSRYDTRLVAGLAAMARASHAQVDRESRLWTASVTDELTGLWAYDHWRTHLRDTVRTRAAGQRLGVVFLDLDHFKQVNSDYGHLRADQLLASIGQRLAAQCPGWRFGRFGGDEFVALISDVRDAAHLDDLCRHVAGVIRQPVEADGITISVTGSLGRAFSAHRHDSAESLLARAERDLRQRKAERIVPAAPIVAFDEDEILRRLLDQGVDVAYQPIVDLRTRQLVGWEALLRGSLPLLGSLNPEQLVGSAVRAGVLDIVTRQLAKQALETVSEASRRLGRRLSLSINLEQEQFRDTSTMIKWVAEEADRLGVDLVLELTERGDAEAWGAREDALADQLERFGVGISLDDLGSGNTRIPLLIRRHWHTVKLDRGLLLSGHRGLVMLTHTVAMLRSLGLTIVMEGVETAEQLELTQELGIDRVQGHYFAAASTAAELFAFVDSNGLDFSQVG